MKILLVKPYNLSDHIQPSLGLGYLATAVRDKANVEIIDCIKNKISIKRFGEIIYNYKPDIVGIQCYTFDLKFIKEALSAIKNINSRIVTIIGGPHPSAVPIETMEYFGGNLDFVYQGEAEKGLPLLIDYLDGNHINLSDIPGLVWKEASTIRINEPYFHNDLDILGFPSWDLMLPHTYPEAQHGAFYKKFPIAPIILTRGCPYSCTFCAGKVVSGKRLRKRSVKNVINEIQILYKDYGIREFHIVDDNFTLDISYAKDFLKQLIAQNLDISLATPNGIRMDCIDGELLALLKQSGLYLISLGIESGSDRILNLMKKNLSVNIIKEKVRFIRTFGFDIAAFFIVGFPGETEEDIRKTIKLSLELDLTRANFFTYLPFPGTTSYQALKEDGELDNVDWRNFYFMNAAYVPKGLSRKKLKSLQRSAFFRFYLRPKIFLRNLTGIKSFRHFGYLSKRFFNWIVR